MTRLFRWICGGFIALVVLGAAGIFFIDPLAKTLIEAQIRSTAGMDVRIGNVSIGVVSPTILIEDLKLYNAPEFGGSPCLDMPELFIEYDRAALRSRQLHLKLVRLNVAEISMIKDKQGRLNFQKLQPRPAAPKTAPAQPGEGFAFTGLDTLNLTLRKARLSKLGSTTPPKEVDFAMTNQIFRNLKSEKDLGPVLLILAGKGGMELFSESIPTPGELLNRQGESIKSFLNKLLPAK